MSPPPPPTHQLDTRRGSRIYSRAVLSVYDLIVLRVSNSLAWRCPTREIAAFYNQHLGRDHLDIGVGTGYFLDTCRFPGTQPAITLVDLNMSSLRVTGARIRRYDPAAICADVLAPLPLAGQFESIAISYLLHCLPGTLDTKAVVFQQLKPRLKLGGVLFGTTILGTGVAHNPFARALLTLYNAAGLFSNTADSRAALERGLSQHFSDYSVHVTGCVALFVGRS